MDWAEILSISRKKILLGQDEFSFSQIGIMASQISYSGPLIWHADWSTDALAQFFGALVSGTSIVVSNDFKEDLPDLKGKEKGWVFLRSSGSEGPSRWISHHLETLAKLTPLYRNEVAAAVLRPGHAAGIEFLIAGIIGNNDLMCFKSASELKPGPTILHGPPTLLAWLLSFSGQNDKLLRGLKKFYNGTDMLHPAIAQKLEASPYAFRIEQLYGTTESWRIPTETNEKNPWLLRFTGDSVKLKGERIGIDSDLISPSVSRPFFPGDQWIEESDGWGRIENNRHWVANFHGSKLNLFDIEEKLLRFPGIDDVEIKVQKNFLGQSLKVTLFTKDSEGARKHAESIFSQGQAEIVTQELSTPISGKRKRF